MFFLIVKSSIAKTSIGRLPIYEAAHRLPYDLDALVMEVVSLPRAVFTIEHPCLKCMNVLFCVYSGWDWKLSILLSFETSASTPHLLLSPILMADSGEEVTWSQ